MIRLTVLFSIVVSFVWCCDASDLTNTINQHIVNAWDEPLASSDRQCSDREFIRRLSLDLIGRIPTVGEVENFASDGRADKREQLVDLLLASEDHVQHFADLFDALLMGRGTEQNYRQRSDHQWRSFLERFVREQRSWQTVAAEILAARPESQEDRGAVWYLYERKDKHQEIAEAIAPSFFGMRIECAQCHDHPLCYEIEQAHYWGLVAFFNRSKNVDTKNGPRVSESAIGGFSEFADLSGDSTPNYLVFYGADVVDEPRPAKDDAKGKSADAKDDAKEEAKEEADNAQNEELFRSPAIEGDPHVPTFSRREKFVSDVLTPHPMLARAMVNRVWAMLMGRGIVHPFDEMDSMHPPSHPELLDELSASFTASGYQIRPLVRSIVLSVPYQLPSLRPDGIENPATFAWYQERPLTAEQLARSIQLALQGSFRNDHPLIGLIRQKLPEVLPDESLSTVSDALFLTNNAALNQFIAENTSDDTLIGRTVALPDHSQRIELLFKTIFHRSPSPDESQAVESYLKKRSDNLQVSLQHVVWSMLTSAEFQLNH